MRITSYSYLNEISGLRDQKKRRRRERKKEKKTLNESKSTSVVGWCMKRVLMSTKKHGDANPHNIKLPFLLSCHLLPLCKSLSHHNNNIYNNFLSFASKLCITSSISQQPKCPNLYIINSSLSLSFQ